MIPVVDLRLKFGMAPTAPTEQTVIIVVQCAVGGRELTMGILVDEVLEVLPHRGHPDRAAAALRRPPTSTPSSSSAWARPSKRVIFLLDIGKVLSASEARDVTGASA